MHNRRIVATAALVGATWITMSAPAFAHGVGERGDLPLPAWQMIWGAAFAVLISFAAVGLLWTAPKLHKANQGHSVGGWTTPLLRVGEALLRTLGVALWAVVLTAGLFGVDNVRTNIAPIATFVVFWVGVQVLSVVVGDIWSVFNPFDTIVRVLARLRPPRAEHTDHAVGRWAPVSLLVFLWLELCWHKGSEPRTIGVMLGVYSAIMIGGGLRHGRGWLHRNEGFTVLFRLLASLAPFRRDEDGSLGFRWPFSGISGVQGDPSMMGLIIVVLGATTFDGMGGVQFWLDITANRSGTSLTVVNTLGMLMAIGGVGLVYMVACELVGRVTGHNGVDVAERYAPTLLPIVFAYALAHYFSLLAFEGQNFLIHISDPYGRGWDLFGTQADPWFGSRITPINYLWISTAAIAWVQVTSIVVGHVAGVASAHDRAVEDHDADLAIRSQYPLVVAMVAYTVVGLVLLFNS
jgi:hypothetical protein